MSQPLSFLSLVFLLNTFASFLLSTPLSAQTMPPAGPFGGTVNAIVANGEMLFAGTETGDVFASSSSGGPWRATAVGNNHLEILSLAADGATLYAGTRNGGIFRTSDNGKTWKQLIPPREVIGKNITALQMIGKTLFVGTDIEGLFVLEGNTLSPRNTGLTSTSIQSIMANGGTLYVATGNGPARSTDGGNTWQMILNDLPEFNWGHTVIMANGTLFTAGSKGVFTSTNGGDSWNGFIQAVLGDGYCELWQTGKLMIAELRQSGAWTSSNGGTTWDRIPNAPSDITNVATHRGELVAAAITGIHRSSNNGKDWTDAMEGLTATAINAIAATSATTAVAATDNGVYAIVDKPGGGGKQWERLSAGPDRWVKSVANHNGAIFAGMTYGGIQRTTDNGKSWFPLEGGFPEGKQISQLVSVGERLYAVTWGGLFATTNNGDTWTNIPIGEHTDGVMTALLANGDTLWAAISGKGIFASTDGGKRWQPQTKGLPEEADINQFAWQGNTLHAIVRTFPSFGQFVDQLYSFNRASKSWRKTPGGPAKTEEITCLISAGERLVVGTNNGLFSSPIPGKPFAPVKSDIASARCGVAVGNALWLGTSWSGVKGIEF
ncbi:MAG: hypothetical protein DYG96_15435 [Chlorobi bacterium CHB2]|nr:hypothetical protein [Chlorobi bacterium CHB2]